MRVENRSNPIRLGYCKKQLARYEYPRHLKYYGGATPGVDGKNSQIGTDRGILVNMIEETLVQRGAALGAAIELLNVRRDS